MLVQAGTFNIPPNRILVDGLADPYVWTTGLVNIKSEGRHEMKVFFNRDEGFFGLR